MCERPPQSTSPIPAASCAARWSRRADGALRIVLNASQSQRTQSSRFLTDYFGSGVQHIAFATDDIWRPSARLKANGVRLLPIPENYYDDLEAKTDLPADQLDDA